ncbi:MAG: OmpA family protein [Alphaproteobacteria bacterium]|nr:OmpA family protein [Alphaproteobacteria bacterium]
MEDARRIERGSSPGLSMNTQEAAKPLLWVGIIGLLATVVFTIWMGPSSASALQKRVQVAADASLVSAQFTWAKAIADGQAVRLEGVAPSDTAKSGARAAAFGAIGAGGPFSGGVTAVSAAGVDVAGPVSPYVWTARRDANGGIILGGVAPNRQTLGEIRQAAHRLYGGKVSGAMALATGAPNGVDWQKAAITGLEALQHLDRGSAELRDGRLLVTGQAPSDAVATEASARVSAAGDNVRIISEIAGPSEWTATLDNGKLVFAGKVASRDAQDLLRKSAGAAFGATPVEDNTVVGATGSWEKRIAAAMPNFSKFQSGKITIQGTAITITGKAPGSALSYLKQDMDRIRDNFTVSYDVAEVAPAVTEIAGVDLQASGGEQKRAACEEAFQKIMADNDILFDSKLAEIDRRSGAVLDKLVTVARSCAALRIEIQGYTDATGPRSKNIELSRNRAEAVRDYLVQNGVAASKLTAKGFGPDHPAASNRTKKGRAQNRRIEFKVSMAENN